MATPILVPVTLPDGRVVQMVKTPGLAAASGQTMAGEAAPPFPVPSPGDGGGGAAPGIIDRINAGLALPGAAGPLGLPAGAGGTVTPPAGPPKSTAEIDKSAQASAERRAPQPEAPAEPAPAQNVEEVPGAQPASPGRWIPGGPTEKSRVVKEGAKISGETLDAIDAGYAAQQDAAQKQRSALETAQTNAAIAADNAILDEREKLDERKARRVAIDKGIEEKNQAREAANKSAEAAAVNPRQYWDSKPGWAKALAGIGIALQAAAQRYVEGMQGQSAQPLRGMDLIKEAWDDNIRDQQIRYEQAKNRADVANNRYKEAIELYGTPEAAKMALEEQNSRLTESYLNNQKQRVQDQTQLNAIDTLIAQIQTQRAEKAAELEALIGDDVTKQIVNQPGRYAGAGGVPGAKPIKPGSPQAEKVAAVDDKLSKLDAAEKWARDQKANGEKYLPGFRKGLVGKAEGAVDAVTGGGAEKGQALGHVRNVQVGVQEPLGKSDSDAAIAEDITVGDGSIDHFLGTVAAERKRLEAQRQSVTGEATGRGAVPGAR